MSSYLHMCVCGMCMWSCVYDMHVIYVHIHFHMSACVVFVNVCVHVCVCTYAYVDVRYQHWTSSSVTLSPLTFPTNPLIEPGAHRLAMCLVSEPHDPFVSCSEHLGYRCATGHAPPRLCLAF